MKQFIGKISLFTITVLLMANCIADPTVLTISFTCPAVKGNDIYVLSNFGTYIGGYGKETVGGNPPLNTPYFTGVIPILANIPPNLQKGGYASSGTGFNELTGMVSCHYKSASFDPFSVSYFITNSQGAIIISQSVDKISINQFVGYSH